MPPCLRPLRKELREKVGANFKDEKMEADEALWISVHNDSRESELSL